MIKTNPVLQTLITNPLQRSRGNRNLISIQSAAVVNCYFEVPCNAGSVLARWEGKTPTAQTSDHWNPELDFKSQRGWPRCWRPARLGLGRGGGGVPSLIRWKFLRVSGCTSIVCGAFRALQNRMSKVEACLFAARFSFNSRFASTKLPCVESSRHLGQSQKWLGRNLPKKLL